MKVNQLLPGNVAWTSPRALGMDENGNVYLDTQAECSFAGVAHLATQSAKVYMGDGEAEKVELPVTWRDALPVLGFKNKVKVKEVKGVKAR
jgi:hypothetical protein